MPTEIVELEGHIVDSLLLAKVLDLILDAGADYTIAEFELGKTNVDPSRTRIEISASDDTTLDALLEQLQVHGANRIDLGDARLLATDRDGVLPVGFYSTTNLDTEVRIAGHWRAVENPEMDCGLVVTDDAIRTIAMHRVKAGDQIVVGFDGVRVRAPSHSRDVRNFEFMNSDVSSEKPKALLIEQVAQRIRAARAAGGKVLAVCGPAVVHTGGAPDVARLVRAGWIDVLFAGNGFATHDMESNVLGTSLGVSVAEGTPVEHGHSNHLRVINEIRRHGSIAAAVEAGFVSGGTMYECVRRRVPFVLGGSVRDDGPLPDTMANVVDAADAMRALVPGVTVALMLASTLHAIATGNLLPAGVETFCVDINQAVVTKLADRGSHQALGIVTDVGPFVHQLADALGA
ncbi:MAG TPA: TIGR00300 family protein [Acidimicrobiales bacterium]|jgi:lysine-ketoglutarate reductase/saccharopine dehydrogenase-like protein (TIGR00300 family)|nr:TIGR00300 family protein [Acidimicrobiales bacterium]